MSEHPAVTRFRDYLRIKTVHPEPDYDGAMQFLTRMAREIGLPYEVIQVNEKPKREVLVMTWEGLDPNLPSIVLNSHTDVVPVFPEHWTYDPFEAVKDEKGDIYARGTQDMKSCGTWYLEAVWKMKKEGKRFPRTIHITFVPDEEVGSALGMEAYVKTDHFKMLNGAFFLDEGLANPTDAFTVFYGERFAWWLRINCSGNPGHGSRFIQNTAAAKLRYVMNKFLELRDKEEKRLNSDSTLRLGDVTSVNMTMLEGGIQHNVVPAELVAYFDVRLTPSVDLEEFENQINQWCSEAGEGVTVEFKQKFMGPNIMPLEDSNPWWIAFRDACQKLDLKLEREIFSAFTDVRYMRQMGLPAIGFSPMNHTPILLHDHDERLNEEVFIRGIDIYCSILANVASVPAL